MPGKRIRVEEYPSPPQKKVRRRKKDRNMKKTTRKGAYKATRKKQFQIRRAPFVETKSKTREDLVTQFGLEDRNKFTVSDTQHKHMNPEVFFAWQQGLEETQCIGQSVYVRYLKKKVTVRFPQPSFALSGGINQIMPFLPQRYELVWGWIPAPLLLTGNTTPQAFNMTLEQINEYINLKVVDYFNERKDYNRFIPKKAATIRIIGRRKVRPDMRYLSTAPPVTIEGGAMSADYAIGTIPDYTTSIKWKCNRKLHLEKSNNLHPTGNGAAGLYNNYSWLPFCTFISWNWDELPVEDRKKQMPSVAWNDCVWYSDS
jgi:hypothetical protein